MCYNHRMNSKTDGFREEWFDPQLRVAVRMVDVAPAAQVLVRGHLCGPTSAHVLAEALAGVALLGAETSEPEEVVSLQMKCAGPLGGLNVECTVDGKLRGYTEKKILDDFDGLGKPNLDKVLGVRQIQVTRSVPGKILSQGVATSLDEYANASLQRAVALRVEAAVTDDVEVVLARGAWVEVLPDAPPEAKAVLARLADVKTLAVASRNLLGKLGAAHAELKKTSPLAFGCRCSPARAAAMLAALPDAERATLPPIVDITCHMCGRLYSVATH